MKKNKQGYRIRIVIMLKDASASALNQPNALAIPPTPKSTKWRKNCYKNSLSGYPLS